jgi:hypothetical protein
MWMGRHEYDDQSLLWQVRSLLKVCHSDYLQLITTYPGTTQEDLRLLPGLVEDGSIHKFIRKRLKKWGYSQVTGVRTVQKGDWQGVIEEIWIHTLTTCCTHWHKVIDIPHSCNTDTWVTIQCCQMYRCPVLCTDCGGKDSELCVNCSPDSRHDCGMNKSVFILQRQERDFQHSWQCVGMVQLSEMWCLILWYINIRVLMETATFNFFFISWWWRKKIALKHWYTFSKYRTSQCRRP